MQIRPSSALRNEYTQISELAKASGKPIFIKKYLQHSLDGNPLPLGGGRRPVRKDASSLVFDILLDNCRGYFPDTTGKVSIGPEYPFLPIVFAQERPKPLPKMICRFLF